MPGIFDAIKTRLDSLDRTYNPFRKVGEAIKPTVKPPDPEQEARARGAVARQEAIARGKLPVVKVDDSIKKIPLR